MEKRKCLVFIGAGKWQTGGIKASKSLGYKTIGFDGDHKAFGGEFCDQFFAVDVKDSEKIAHTLDENGICPDGIIAYCSEIGMKTAAHLRERFNLPGPGVAMTDLLTHKDLQRKALRESGIDDVKCFEVSGPEQVPEVMKELSLPVIVKPTDSSGSRGVTKVERQAELMEAVTGAFTHSHSQKILIEEFIEGIEYTVESFTVNGETSVIAVTEKQKLPRSRGTVSIALKSPVNHLPSIKAAADKVRSYFKHINYPWGAGHSEVMIRPDGEVKIIEIAGRGGGFGVFEYLLPTLTGVDLAALICRAAVGEEIAPIDLKAKYRHFSLKFFPVFESGVVKSVKGLDGIDDPNIQLGSFVSAGDKVKCENTDGSRLGYMLITASSEEELQRKTNLVESTVKFEVSHESV